MSESMGEGQVPLGGEPAKLPDNPVVLDFTPGEDNSVAFTIGPKTRGQDVLATLRFLAQPDDFNRKVALIVGHRLETDDVPTLIRVDDQLNGSLPPHISAERTIRLEKGASVEDLKTVLGAAYAHLNLPPEEMQIRINQKIALALSGMVNNGRFLTKAADGTMQGTKVKIENRNEFQLSDEQISEEMRKLFEE